MGEPAPLVALSVRLAHEYGILAVFAQTAQWLAGVFSKKREDDIKADAYSHLFAFVQCNGVVEIRGENH